MKPLMHEVCPFRIGSRVKINPDYTHAKDWPGNYAVVGIRWDYQHGDGHGVGIDIASDEEITHRNGCTGPFKITDLLPA